MLKTKNVLFQAIPEKRSAIEARLASLENTQPERVEQNRLWEKLFDKNTTPAEIAAAGGKETNKEKRKSYYRQALRKAANLPKSEFIKFRSSILEHPESEERDWLLDRINYYISGKTADEGDLDKAVELTKNIKNKRDRLSMLAFLSLKIYEKGEIEKAKRISREIAMELDLIGNKEPPATPLGYSIYSNVFRTLAIIEPQYAFDVLEIVLPDSKKFIMPAPTRYNPNGYNGIRDLLRRHRFSLLPYARAVRSMAETDFDRLKKMTDYFDVPEISIFSKILILKVLIHGNLDFANFKDRREMVIVKN